MDSISKVYKYSFFGIMGVLLIGIPALLLFPIVLNYHEHGFEDVFLFFAFVYDMYKNDNLSGFILLIALLILMIILYFDRLLVVLFTKLTITEQEIIYQNLFMYRRLHHEEILGWRYEGKRYVIYSKYDMKKKITVDIFLNHSDEITHYLKTNFAELP